MPLRLKSLSAQLTIVFTTLAAGLVVILSFFAFEMATRSLEESVRQDLFNIVDQATSAIDKEIEERVREVQTISLSPTIRAAAMDLSESHLTIPIPDRREDALREHFGGLTCLKDRPEIARHLEAVRTTHPYISDFLLTDRFGIAIGCTSVPQNIRHSQETWWQEAVSRGVSLTNLFPDPKTGTYRYAVAVAIPDGQRSPAGVLRATINLDEIREMLKYMRIGERGYVVAMARSGRLFAHPNPDYIDEIVQDHPELAHLAQVVSARESRGVLIYEPAGLQEGGEPGGASIRGNVRQRAVSQDGDEDIEALAWAPEKSWILAYGRMFRPASLGPLGWTVAGMVSRSEVIAPIAAIRSRISAIGGSAILIAIALVWYLSRRLAKPLNDLAQKADLIAAGDLSVYLSIPSRNEIGRLASALASMVESLSEANRSLARTNANLEKIVAERTSELREKSHLVEEQSKQVLEASRLKSQFLANMSHELRTPLNAILALSDILAQRISGDLNEEQVKQVTIINRSGGNLLRLINDILDLSKIEAGRMEVHLDVFHLRSTLSSIKDTIEPLAEDKGLDFQIIVDPGLPASIKSDDPKLRQVLLNLLGNAVKFTDAGSVSLTISREYRRLPGSDEQPPAVTEDGPFWLEVKVRDTGVGIGAEALQHIFEEFQQADGSTTRKYGGSGLGLAISKKIVELLGGEISVQSQEGKGSVFTAMIPMEGVIVEGDTVEQRPIASIGAARIARAAVPPPALTADARAMPTGTRGLPSRHEGTQDGVGGQKPWITPLREHPVPISPRFLDIRDDSTSLLPHIPTLLVVDDDPESLYVYRQFLTRQGYQVIFAINGEQVLDKAHQFHPVAIILDLMLPHKSGWEVLEELKTADDVREIPVIIASALDHRDRGLCAGAYRFLTKPMSERQLVGVLKDLELVRKKDFRKVLVIDDDPVELGIARTLFEKAGLDVTTISNGTEAVEHAMRQPPDIIILDLLMPRMDGFEVLSRLRAEPSTSSIPVLIYTAKDVTEEDRRRLLPSARRIFPKVPLQIEEMLEELEAALQALSPHKPHRSRSGGTEPVPAEKPPASPLVSPGTPLAADLCGDEDTASIARVVPDSSLESPPDDPEGDSREESGSEITAPLPARARILLVEDDSANQYSISFLLRAEGYQVTIAENGEEGIQAAERERPDLILMDMMMPVMSGFDATRELKSRPAMREIPIIALTAAAMAGDRERTLAAGCDDYVSKPIDRVLLLERVSHWRAHRSTSEERSIPAAPLETPAPAQPEPVGSSASHPLRSESSLEFQRKNNP